MPTPPPLLPLPPHLYVPRRWENTLPKLAQLSVAHPELRLPSWRNITANQELLLDRYPIVKVHVGGENIRRPELPGSRGIGVRGQKRIPSRLALSPLRLSSLHCRASTTTCTWASWTGGARGRQRSPPPPLFTLQPNHNGLCRSPHQGIKAKQALYSCNTPPLHPYLWCEVGW